MIRKAQPEDTEQLARLSYIIWEGLETDLVQHIERTRLLDVIERSMTDVKYRGHIDNIWVYIIEGQVAGCLIAYPGKDELELEKAWLELDLDEDIRAYGLPMPTKEAKDDEWYIETVATFPEYRGRGVATALFRHVIGQHPDYQWSLNCDVDNTGALSLYHKLGFESAGTIDLYGHEHYHMVLSDDARERYRSSNV